MNSADEALMQGVRQRDRRALAKTITLLESTRSDHRLRADALLNILLPETGKAMRLGISGFLVSASQLLLRHWACI